MSVCRVPGCIAEAITEGHETGARSVCPIGICTVHLTLPDEELRELLKRDVGLLKQLQPVTDRVERDEDGLPVRFYPETR